MDKKMFEGLFGECIENSYEFQEYFKECVKNSFKEMVSTGQINFEIDTKLDWEDEYLTLKIKIDEEEIRETNCLIK